MNDRKDAGRVGKPSGQPPRGGRACSWRRALAAVAGLTLALVGWGPALPASASTTTVTVFGVDPSSAVVSTASSYTVTLQTSASGALAGGSGTVTLTGPSGLVWPASASSYSVNDISDPAASATVTAAPVVSGGGDSVELTVPSTVAAGALVQLVVQGVANPATASSADTLTIASSADTVPATADFAVAAPGSITGTVSDGAGALVGATVIAQGPGFAQATTVTGGAYTLSGLVPGSYNIEFIAPGDTSEYWGGPSDAGTVSHGDATPLVVGSGAAISGISVTLPAVPTGSVSGTVTSGGSPLGSVCVSATGAAGQPEAAQTAANGTYTIANLAAGKYEVQFGAQDCYGSSSTPVLPAWYPGNVRSVSLGGLVSVGAGQAVTGVDGQVLPAPAPGATGAGSVTGTVTGVAGQPLAGICVSAGSAFATTSTTGTYTLSGLDAGTYDVSFRPCSYGHAVNYVASELAATVGTSAVTLDAQLQPGGTIVGRTTDSSGNPLAGICVSANGTGNQPYYSTYVPPQSATTGPSGLFVLTGLPNDSYDLQLYGCASGTLEGYGFQEYGAPNTHPGPITISSSQGLVTGISVQMAEGGTITGTVTDTSGQPVAGACVTMANASFSVVGTTDLNGYYLLSDVTPGSGQQVAVEGGCATISYNPAGTYFAGASSAADLTVTAGSVTSAPAVQLPPGGAFTGTVTSGGQPVAGVCVQAAAVGGSGAGSGTGSTDATGAYRISSLPVGSYTVSFASCNTAQFAPDYYDNQSTAGAATPVAVVSGSPAANIDASLQPLASVTTTTTAVTSTTTQVSSGGSPPTTSVTTTSVPTGTTTSVPTVTTTTLPSLPPASSPAPPPPFANPASYPTVGASALYNSSTGGTVASSVGGATATLSIPSGALPDGTTVSVYDGNATALAEQVGAGTVVTGFAVSWKTPAGTTPPASVPLTLTIDDPNIKAGDVVYEQTYGGGLEAVGIATTNGQVTITFTLDPSFVVAAPLPGSRAHLEGYRLVGAAGAVEAYGRARAEGSASGKKLGSPIVGASPSPDGNGYWLVSRSGGVFAYGDAHFYGSAAGRHLAKPVVAIAATPDGRGYWLAESNGAVVAFGDAHLQGPARGMRLSAPIVGMMADDATGGYWLVAADGGIFAYGAPFLGSTGHLRLKAPIVGGAALPDGTGYRLAAADGGVFAFGTASFRGSAAAEHLAAPIVGMVGDGAANGYWLVARDGGLFAFGGAAYKGSATSRSTGQPTVAVIG